MSKKLISSLEEALQRLGENCEEVIELRKLEAANITSHILYYQQLVCITKALNEEWEPDWKNGKQDKYDPWFRMESAFSYIVYVDSGVISNTGSRLCFKSGDLAKYSGTKFESIYKKFLTK